MDEQDPGASEDYQLTQPAAAELESLLRFIADRDGTQRALLVHGKFLEAFEVLEAQPGAGATPGTLTGDHLRWWPVYGWLEIYDSTSDPIIILRVIHGARELERLLRADE